MSYFVQSRSDDEVLDAFSEKPELAQDRTLFPSSCLRESSAVARYLISHGDISAINDKDRDGMFCLERLISRGRDLDFIETVLAAGANPNLGRTIIMTYNRRPADKVQVLNLLLKYGADVNKVFAMYGDRKNVRSALDFCSGDTSFVAALKNAGAKSAKEILKENPGIPIDGVQEK